MTEKQNTDSEIKERREQIEKNLSYQFASLKDAQDNWQVFSGYLAGGKFGEEGINAYNSVIGEYFGTQNFNKQRKTYNDQLNKKNEFLYQPYRNASNGEILEHVASSAANTFGEIAKLNPQSLEELLESAGSIDEKRKKYVDELQKVREKEIKHYIETGKVYEYNEEEKKIVDQVETFIGASWMAYNMANSAQVINEHLQSKPKGLYDKIYKESGLEEEEKKKQEETVEEKNQ